MVENDWCIPFNETARRITPSEALPYFEAWAEKAGFKEGVKFKSALSRWDYVFSKVRPYKDNTFNFLGGEEGCLFNNDINTFATLVKEEELEPLKVNELKFSVQNEDIIEVLTDDNMIHFYHSEIEQLYQYSLKAQGK
jgi:hypothetical protein